jgi:hypothetical protein
MYLPKTNNHASLYDTIASRGSIDPTSQVYSAAMLVYIMVFHKKWNNNEQ